MVGIAISVELMTICKRDWIIFERRERTASFDFFTSAFALISSVHLYKYSSTISIHSNGFLSFSTIITPTLRRFSLFSLV